MEIRNPRLPPVFWNDKRLIDPCRHEGAYVGAYVGSLWGGGGLEGTVGLTWEDDLCYGGYWLEGGGEWLWLNGAGKGLRLIRLCIGRR
jgi:hypothetical protein